jgi:hypothetical protein
MRMSWHEERDPRRIPPPHCPECDDSGRVHSDHDGDWIDCPGCRKGVPGYTQGPPRVTVTDDDGEPDP